MPDDIDVHSPTAVHALAQWDTATAGITRLWAEGSARIQQLAAAAPWGDDSAGASFHAAYTKDGGPEVIARIGKRIMEDVDTLGGNVRTAVTHTRRTDRTQAGNTLSM
ncbi:hypothetical protein [Sphaerisporangium dianthi]|uniref:WXG100 family type VII secretion target n=1 Tax=Sphaerisporangium dianthi TaxID=1436120 RepID=A0ABV9C8U3_9ACTN